MFESVLHKDESTLRGCEEAVEDGLKWGKEELEKLPKTRRTIAELELTFIKAAIGFVPGSNILSVINGFMDARKIIRKKRQLDGKEGNILKTEVYQELEEAEAALKIEKEKAKLKQDGLEMLNRELFKEKTHLRKLLDDKKNEEVGEEQLLKALLSDFTNYNEQLTDIAQDIAKQGGKKRDWFFLIDEEIKREKEFVAFLNGVSKQEYDVEIELGNFLNSLLSQQEERVRHQSDISNLTNDAYATTFHQASPEVLNYELPRKDDSKISNQALKDILVEVREEQNIFQGLIKIFGVHINELGRFKQEHDAQVSFWDDNFWREKGGRLSALELGFFEILKRYVTASLERLNKEQEVLSKDASDLEAA